METPMQKLRFFVSDGLNDFDESVKVSEIWEKINELLKEEKIEFYQKKINKNIDLIQETLDSKLHPLLVSYMVDFWSEQNEILIKELNKI